MHRILRNLLDKAEGKTQHIIAIFLDIRGFSSFCQGKDSLEIATYIKCVYARVIDNYFSNAVFFKPTGDGLFIVIACTQQSLREVVSRTVKTCLDLHKNFGELCKDSPIINFQTPDKLGIGVARGSAYCISSGDTILDYSGKVINLASRLMNLARPSGIVLDSDFGLNLLPNEIQALFQGDSVYITGLAEKRSIYFTKQFTLIPDFQKQPLKEPKWNTELWSLTFGQIKESLAKESKWVRAVLEKRPLARRQIFIDIRFSPEASKPVMGFLWDTTTPGVFYREAGNKFIVNIDTKQLIELLTRRGARDEHKISFEYQYPSTE